MRYLNMFVLIGIALFGVGLAKLLSHGRMLAEPGQMPGPQDAWIYLGAGVLMLVNGIVSVRQMVPTSHKPAEKEIAQG
jgi:hypothetical protein